MFLLLSWPFCWLAALSFRRQCVSRRQYLSSRSNKITIMDMAAIIVLPAKPKRAVAEIQSPRFFKSLHYFLYCNSGAGMRFAAMSVLNWSPLFQ
jgi:hypothetical protein